MPTGTHKFFLQEQVLGYPSVQANWPPNLERLYMSPYSFESKPGLWQTLVKLSPNLRYFAPPDEPDSIFTNQGLSLLGSLQKLEVLSMSCVRQDTADIELLAKHIRNFPSLRRIGLPIDDDDLEEHVDLLEAARPGISVEIS